MFHRLPLLRNFQTSPNSTLNRLFKTTFDRSPKLLESPLWVKKLGRKSDGHRIKRGEDTWRYSWQQGRSGGRPTPRPAWASPRDRPARHTTPTVRSTRLTRHTTRHDLRETRHVTRSPLDETHKTWGLVAQGKCIHCSHNIQFCPRTGRKNVKSRFSQSGCEMLRLWCICFSDPRISCVEAPLKERLTAHLEH